MVAISTSAVDIINKEGRIEAEVDVEIIKEDATRVAINKVEAIKVPGNKSATSPLRIDTQSEVETTITMILIATLHLTSRTMTRLFTMNFTSNRLLR